MIEKPAANRIYLFDSLNDKLTRDGAAPHRGTE
jgi:hypothetical protein